DVYTTIDPISLQTLSVTDANGTQRGTTYDGFGRPKLSMITPPGGAPGAMASYAYFNFGGGPSLGSAGGRYVQTTAFTDPVPLANVATAAGRVSTTYFDELGRPRFSKALLGADYANDALIVGARTYDDLGRVLFEADPYPASQDGTTAYGTTHYFSADGSPFCFIRGKGPQPFTTVPDAATERFPMFFRHSFAVYREQMSVQDAAALTPGSPQDGVIKAETTSALGRVLFRSTWQGTTRLEHASFTHDHLGQMTSMTRYQDAVNGASGVTTSWGMDSLGQLQSLQEQLNPTQYREYSRFGELLKVKWTPPAPELEHSVIHRYDGLSRLVHSEEQNGGVTDFATVNDYFYDVGVAVSPQVQPTYMLGRLAHAVAPTGDVFLSYDAFGNVNARTFTDPGETAYVEQHSFHGDGSLAAL